MPRKNPAPAKRLKHLKNTIIYLKNSPTIAQLSEVSRLLNSFSENLEHLPHGQWEKKLPKLEIPIDASYLKHHNPVLVVGGIIKGNDSDITFSSLSLCIIFATDSTYRASTSDSCCLINQRKLKRIVRRFHFDFQPESKGHPISHLQYGGNIPPEYSEYHYCIEDLDNPRFHYPPIDIVLLLDMIMKEFPTLLNQLSFEDYWRGLVFESQELWWKSYSDNLKACVSNSHGKTFHETIYCD